ncbi:MULTISPECIES: Lcl C-terminal domain-containing protein [Xanthomonas]|uniref:Lcl C-terminal domain-containing protein n=2 Tax=Xanthomonas citri TaxID=346 RepID=A0AB33CIU6_XANCI|nr:MULTISPECIES: DUF1566 domain-containing protein [Xanthomonas]MBV6780925.1 DUF1566 domain-containing protein [Xanthomonas campestris pv. trichodesmae]ASK91845.1 hypothetical protein XcvCFBP7111P_10300 [Xanthomonas citri pv. vignicola]MBV6788449.1 DUF1566 domain-containing protein [Xanthomonas campestris pv. clerodendri]MBZ3919234.1 hypothetical protein [Xanthomonas campestris pv. trichodesmae]MBZ3922885.1 hypothetical protein [Xanthomonas citri pv. sesbaniae]
MSSTDTLQQIRFTQTHGGVLTVIDATTGLEWSAQPVARNVSHQDAAIACAGLQLGGHHDWRLPTRQELLSLVDLTRHAPAIDTDAFPNFPSQWFWTSDLCAWSPASAWGVYFGSGDVYDLPRDGGGFALAVRRAGQ